jgi:hypothetical protein
LAREVRSGRSAVAVGSIDFAKRRINVKLAGLWVIGIGLSAGVSLLTVEQAYAGENDHSPKCTLETLKGQYLGAANGMLIPPVPLFSIPATTPPLVTAAAFYSTYYGDGTGMDWVTFTVNGVNADVTSPTPTQYILNSDCTGTKTVLPSGPHFDIFVAIDGSGLTAVVTDQGFAASESDRRVGP